jgi:HEAT repeat protein
MKKPPSSRRPLAMGLGLVLVAACRNPANPPAEQAPTPPGTEQKPPPARIATDVAWLKDPDPIKRRNTAYALGSKLDRWIRAHEPVQAEVEAAVPALASALKDENEDVRSVAADALGMIGSQARAAVPALTAALKDPAMKVRHDAAKALGAMGPAAAAAIPALTTAARDDPEPWSRDAAAEALKKVSEQP